MSGVGAPLPSWWRVQAEIAKRVGADLLVIIALVVALFLLLYVAGILRPVT